MHGWCSVRTGHRKGLHAVPYRTYGSVTTHARVYNDILFPNVLQTLGDVDGVDAEGLVHGRLLAQAGAEVD
jgi:hypothetical protein